MCLNITIVPSGSKMVIGFSASFLFLHGVPSRTKTDVAPVSVTVRVGLIIIACNCSKRHSLVVEEVKVTIVFLSLSDMMPRTSTAFEWGTTNSKG
jgi:hypothetical protein